jgi:hypothetical protein
MHSHSVFTATQVLWTLTFAAQLVLLVVLLGRDRARRFPWFTISIVLAALRLLGSRLLAGRLAPLAMNEIFITLEGLAALVSLLVLVEMARRAFDGVERRMWVGWALVTMIVTGCLLWVWGPWPVWKTLTADSTLARLRLMQFGAEKGNMLADMLAVELGLLVAVAGRRFKAGWRSHPQRILIGLSTAAIAQLAVQGVWQLIARRAVPHSQAEYERILGLGNKLVNANKAVYVVVLVWWIACLWKDEPEAGAQDITAEPVYASPRGTEVDEPSSEGRENGE